MLLAWRQEASTDLGFHLAAGRWILEHRAWPQVDSLTWPLAGRPYVDMNGLFQVALSLAYRGGMIGVGLLRVAFALATFGVLWIAARRRGVESPALLGIGFAIALLTWEIRLYPRPELVSGLCFAAQLYLLRRHADTNDRRFLLATVPLQLAWVYSHSLSFFGIAVLGLYAVTRRRPLRAAPWLALAGATAALFLNPYGVRGVAWQLSLAPRASEGNVFADFQGELWSPFSTMADRFPSLVFFKIMLVATAVALLARPRRVSLFDWAVVVLFGALAAMKMRFVSMFAVVALPIALEAASASIGRALERRTATVAVLAAIALACQQTISGGLYAHNRYPFRFGHDESPAMFPVGTVRTLEESSLGGPIFNAIEAGGYLEQHLPGEKAFVDGRLEVMDEDFYRPYLRAVFGDGWDALEERWHPTVALVPAGSPGLVHHLLAEPGWALVDLDAVSFLFARTTPDHRGAIDAGQERLRRLDAPAATAADAISPPPRRSRLAALFGRKDVPFEAFGRGVNFLQVGMFEAARRELRRALLAWDEPEPALVKSYVVAVAELGRLDEARAWCRWLLETAPEDPEARALLARLGSSGS
ncbi:MAG TPA: tetratricopeptide repeat protein [Anaeromyxobacter sp.]